MAATAGEGPKNVLTFDPKKLEIQSGNLEEFPREFGKMKAEGPAPSSSYI